MHEISVATGIVEIALKVQREHGKQRIVAVHLVIGALTCVDETALRFALGSAARGTTMEGASVMIESPEPMAFCSLCLTNFPANGFMASCPGCGSFDAEIVSGRELYVKSIEAE